MSTDITYTTGSMFTTFMPESKEGEQVWREMAIKMGGVAKVMSFEADSVIKQLRNAGYVVRRAKPVKMSNDELLEALGV